MNRLPNMMVLDFCKYLKRKSKNSIAVLDLLSVESNGRKLQQYAEEYLSRHSYSFKRLLHRYIDSKYFNESLHNYPYDWVEGNRQLQRMDLHHLREMAEKWCCYGCCERGFQKFIDSFENNEEFSEYNVDVWSLIGNVHNTLRGGESSDFILECMTSLGINLSTEIDFLEWIISSQDKPLKIFEMPVSVFESLVDEYILFCREGAKTKKQLMKSFKQTESYFFTSLLERFLPDANEKKARSLRHVISRYYGEKSPYKCVFLPLAAETEEYKRLINDYWRDLHHISADHLDIYYSEIDYGKSGSEIQNSIRSLPQNLKTTFPCVVLWNNNIKEAKSVDIGGLVNQEIVYVINTIVNAIKQGESFDRIIKEANKVAQDIREKNKPINNNTVNIHGDNHGVAVAANSGSISNTSNINCAPSEFSKEVAEAVEKIKKIEELTVQQQTLLTDILLETKKAFEDGSEPDKEKSKSRFKDAMCFLGNVSIKVLSALSSLANLAKFFGI
jgi:hypothetical protein